jgi:branched-chain amino acid transport system permease protein
VSAFTGFAFAAIALRSRGLLFSIITMALCTLLVTLATKSGDVTGGDNGLPGIALPSLNIPGLVLNQASFYILVLVVTLLCYFLMYRIIKSPYGLALQGIRDDEGRMAHLGYNTLLFKLSAFAIAGGFAGLAGVMFASCNGVMVPAHLGVVTSVIAILMVIMGGMRNIYGPVVGAVVVVGLENVVSLWNPERWPLILGCIFVITVLFLRGGLTPYILRLWRRVTKRHGSN